ncbi:MAG: hypothetical protein PVI06_00330 [Desulfobacterales bacterium]|jgi:hypothetical protein
MRKYEDQKIARSHAYELKDNPMKRFSAFLTPVFSFILIAYGCVVLGPSEADVIDAMEASLRSFQASMHKQNLELHETYANAVDLAFINGDRSLLHNMSVMMKDSKVFVSGECVFAEYQDTQSEYLINGNIAYHLKFPRSFNPRGGSGRVNGKITLAGGRVEKLDYSFSVNSNGVFEDFTVTVNGKNMDMTKYQNQINFIKFMKLPTLG